MEIRIDADGAGVSGDKNVPPVANGSPTLSRPLCRRVAQRRPAEANAIPAIISITQRKMVMATRAIQFAHR